MNIASLVKENILFLDGAMGTMLQQAGLAAGELPELWNLSHPRAVTEIHRQYVEAGADIVSTNTFGANPGKLAWGGADMEAVIPAAVANAKASGARYVALDVGPLDQLMEPMGTMTFGEAYDVFARQAVCGEKSGADLVLIETISDLYEAKAAVLAVKENTSLPVICSLSFQEDGRTFVGCDPVSAALTLSGLGVDALGVNCSLGPKELLPIVGQLLKYASVPVIAQPNAGLPQYENGLARYVISPEAFAGYAAEMARMGVRLLGGCCGTTPGFIRALRKAAGDIPFAEPPVLDVTAVCSGSKAVFIGGGVTVIGERLNPTGKKKLKEAIRSGRYGYMLGEAADQAEAGCDALDVNVGLPEIDEPKVMAAVVKKIQGEVNIPLQIDSSSAQAIEAGVRVYNGKPLINSVSGKRESMESVFPVAKKYGAVIVGLTLDENGIPATAAGRLEIARKIVETAGEYGIAPRDVIIDCLVLTASAQQEQVMETIKAIRLVKAVLGVKTVLGVSNVSFGLPSRERLNAAFLTAALGAGLDAAIINPLSERYAEALDCFRVFNGQDSNAGRYISKYAKESKKTDAQSASGRDLKDVILRGRKEEAAPETKRLLAEMPALDIVNRYFIPALDAAGQKFGNGEIFLPQLLQSAEAVKSGFDIVKAHMKASGETGAVREKILMATVKGDIHDIGKNIVCVLLENYGYEVIDLGRDVPPEAVAEAIRAHGIRLAGLSALMTTTVESMKETIAYVRAEGLTCAFIVGGAVMTPEYAEMVGADFYAKDAMAGVEAANLFFRREG